MCLGASLSEPHTGKKACAVIVLTLNLGTAILLDHSVDTLVIQYHNDVGYAY